ncbi:MAG TPA: hypothetical protein VFD97_01855 [Acidimicrobiia bacterium]|nr:hypothetical protein [Acidimicrobiia bacterium]
MRALSTAAWFAVLSGLITGWLAIIHAFGAEDVAAAVSLLAAGLVFGLLSLALLRTIKQ